jgi:hypothetical protein
MMGQGARKDFEEKCKHAKYKRNAKDTTVKQSACVCIGPKFHI